MLFVVLYALIKIEDLERVKVGKIDIHVVTPVCKPPQVDHTVKAARQ